MKRYYLDSNVVLDFLLDREPFAEAAEKLFAAAEQLQVELLVSSLTFITAHYVISKRIGRANATAALAILFAQVTVVPVDALITSQALRGNAPDFEDAVQLYAALAAEADTIVTRDPKGFPGSPLPVLDPLAALRQL